MVDDTQQSGISTSMMMDKPIYFGNGLKISKYDQVRLFFLFNLLNFKRNLFFTIKYHLLKQY